jgi:hypothetical protein
MSATANARVGGESSELRDDRSPTLRQSARTLGESKYGIVVAVLGGGG